MDDLTNFAFDNIANLEALVQHIISCVCNNATYTDFRKALSNSIESVTLDIQYNDSDILYKKEGYALRKDDGNWIRNDDGKIAVYTYKENADYVLKHNINAIEVVKLPLEK